MASNYTENYGLCQWEATDQVLRTEFNEDNTKVEAALNTLAENVAQKADQTALDAVETLATKSRFTKLQEIKTATASARIVIDLSDVDWSQWDKVHLDMITTNGSQMEMYINNTSSQYVLTVGGSQGKYQPRVTLYVGFQPERMIFLGQRNAFYSTGTTFSQLKQLIIYGSDDMDPGALFEVWGEK